MALDSAKFMEVQKRARKIMDMDRNGQLDKYAQNNSGSLMENGEINFEPLTELPQNQVPSAMSSPMVTNVPKNLGSKKLPKEILESFQTQQIDTSGLEIGGSVLDSIGIPKMTRQNKKMNITETVQQPVQQQVTQSASIDYSLIKTIVEDCMRKSLASIKKSMLTESKTLTEDNNLALLKIGDSFKFVTNSGDIYEAKLVKRGNVNDRKKA